MSVPILCGIYAIRNTVSGKVYVGSAVNVVKRWGEHRCVLNNVTHHCQHLQRAWTKYGAEALVFEILERVTLKEDLIAREQFYIDSLSVGALYNTSLQAGSSLGTKRSPESRAKMSACKKGRSWSDGLREKRRAAAKARGPVSAETRAKMSAALQGNTHLLGHKHSEESRAKMAASHLGRQTWWLGRKHSETARAKISAGQVGRKHSAESSAKKSVSMKAYFARKVAPECKSLCSD